MPEACPIPTPAERAYCEVLFKAKAQAFEKVVLALKEAEQAAVTAFAANGLDGIPPDHGYFVFGMYQKLYCILCGADPKTFAGGDPGMAIHVIRNAQNIAKRYWGADIEPYPRTEPVPVAP